MPEPRGCKCPEGWTCGSPQCDQVLAHPEKFEVRDGAVFVKVSEALGDSFRPRWGAEAFRLPTLEEAFAAGVEYGAWDEDEETPSPPDFDSWVRMTDA